MMYVTADSPKHEGLVGPKISLKPHQLAMLQRCKEIESLSHGYGIMSDKPGAGKTYVILSLLFADAALPEPKGTNIIVVPLNIYTQWNQAIEAFGGDLTVTRYISYEQITELYFTTTLEQSDIILTTSVYYNVVADSLKAADIRVKRVFVDEIDSVDAILTKKMECDTFWMISASYIQTRIGELSNVFDFAEEESVTCKCEDAFVDASFGLDQPKTNNHVCRSSLANLMLKDVLDDKELKAVHASDFSSIVRYHYTRVAQNEKEAVLFILKDMAMSIDAEKLSLADYQRTGRMLSDLEEVNRRECEDRIEMFSYRLDELLSRIRTLHLCVGCLDRLNDEEIQYTTSCCEQRMCAACIDHWYSHTLYCPYCRGKPDKETHTTIEATAETPIHSMANTEFTQHDKLGMVLHLLAEKTGKKVIVFSDFSKVFSSIRSLLTANDIPYVELDAGNVTDMDAILYEYKYGTARVLMVNSSFYGCGMNLENTSDIIFYHKTKREMYYQVIGRAQRPGRTRVLQIHNLLYISE